MLQTSSGLGLGAETLDILLAGQLACQDHLDGDNPIQAKLPRFVHDTHPAPGNFFKQFVIAKVTQPRSRRPSNSWDTRSFREQNQSANAARAKPFQGGAGKRRTAPRA
jgi:hypothetical protein